MLENIKKLENMIYSGNYIIYYVGKVASEFLGCLVLSKETQHYLVKPPKPPGMPSRRFFVLGGGEVFALCFETLSEESPTHAAIANRTVCATISPMEGSGRWLAIEDAICFDCRFVREGGLRSAQEKGRPVAGAPLFVRAMLTAARG